MGINNKEWCLVVQYIHRNMPLVQLCLANFRELYTVTNLGCSFRASPFGETFKH